jgi:hypothetical protein
MAQVGYDELVDHRSLGGIDVFPIAPGCIGMSGMYGAADENDASRRFMRRWMPG